MDKALAFKDRILNKENLNPKTWMKTENIKGFKDFILQKESEETDGRYFDDENMLLESEKYYMEAAKKNDVDTMKLLGKSVNVNAKNVHDRTALHYAVAGRNQEAVELLLQRRAKLDVQDKHGVTAAHLAAWFGSLAILKLLIQAGADQKIENQEGMTIMHCAAINNHTDIVTYIVNDLQMKELDKEDQSGKLAFSRAAEHGCVPMMELLLEEPFSMATMQEDQNGNTPLHLAAKNGHLNATQLLLQNFDNRNEVNKAGETSLFLAANSAYEDCVQALLEADCDPNIVTAAKNAALHPVAEKGYTSLVKLLTDNGANMNLQNQHLHSPFHLAVKNCHIPVIHALLKAGCDTDITDHVTKWAGDISLFFLQRGQTALHIAAELGKADVVEMILKADTDLSLRDKQEKTPLGVAARGNMVIIVDMIIKAERYFAWKKELGGSKNVDQLSVREDRTGKHGSKVISHEIRGKANVEFNETLHNDFPLTFKLDHSAETKQIRATIWNLAYNLLKPNDWKKLAQHWDFTGPQIAAIEEQWTGLKSYQEHGNRMMLIWLHGVCMAGKNATKELHESLLSTGYTSIADKIRADTNGKEMRKCSVS